MSFPSLEACCSRKTIGPSHKPSKIPGDSPRGPGGACPDPSTQPTLPLSSPPPQPRGGLGGGRPWSGVAWLPGTAGIQRVPQLQQPLSSAGPSLTLAPESSNSSQQAAVTVSAPQESTVLTVSSGVRWEKRKPWRPPDLRLNPAFHTFRLHLGQVTSSVEQRHHEGGARICFCLQLHLNHSAGSRCSTNTTPSQCMMPSKPQYAHL